MNKTSLANLSVFVVIFFMNLYQVKNYLIGIDLGTEFFKATILRPSKPFTMLENIQSKTKTPTSISLKDDERVYGADAIAKKPKIPKNVLTYFHEYLAQKHNSEEVKDFLSKYFISYDMEEDEDRHTVNIKMNFNKEEFKFSPEEIFGMLFRYIKFLADKFTNSDIKDCVVTVPNFYGYKQRQAIAQAVEMSKFNLLGIVNENVGAAVQFGQNKLFNNTEYFIFYNMGSSYTQATLVSYLSNTQERNNKTVEVSKTVQVLGESWDKHLGGNAFNYNLVRHLMKKFDESPQRKGKASVQGDYKVAERILPAAIKYKEILSANKDVPVTILGVDSGMNLETRLTRDEFEEINSKDFERVYEPIEKLLNRTGLTLDKISQIELLGGSIRIPKIQELLKSKLGNYSNIVGIHMNGDDSMAFGTAYICANFSSNFKGGKIELYHGPNYDIKVQLRHFVNQTEGETNLPICGENHTDLADTCIRRLDKNATVYKVRRGLDLARTVSFKHDGDFQIFLYQKFEDSEEESLLATYTVTGVQDTLAAMKKDLVTTQPKVVLRFKQDARGIIMLKAEITYDMVLYLQVSTGPTGGTEFIYQPTPVERITFEEAQKLDEEMKTKNMTESEKSMLKMRKDVGKNKTQEVKNELKVTVEYSEPRPLTKEEITKSKAKLDALDEIDRMRIKTMERRNGLESVIYARRDWMDSQDSKDYARTEELEEATKQLNDIAEWFDDKGYTADFDNLDSKFNDLENTFKQFDVRKDKHLKREKSILKFHSEIAKVLDDAKDLLKTKPWLHSHYNETFLREVHVVHTWFNETKTKQDNLTLQDEPVMLAENIENKIQIVKREYYFMTRLPKPKEAPKNETVVEENKTEENKTEENKTEENKTEENKTEENKSEEKKTEEEKKEPDHKSEEL